MSLPRNRKVAAMVLLVLLVVACGDGSSGGRPDDEESRGNDSTEATSGGEGGGMVRGGEIPDFFPSDIQLPDGLSIGFVSQDSATGNMALSGTFENGDSDSIQAGMIADMNAAGYEQLASSDDIAVFIKNGVGRVRIRTRVFLGDLTLTIDIDNWTDEQLDELRALNP